MVEFLKLVGGLGIVLISAGILSKNRRTQDVYYVLGGLCLEAYSIHVQDLIFIVLQLIFISAAVYDYFKNQTPKKW